MSSTQVIILVGLIVLIVAGLAFAGWVLSRRRR
ncbi:hypothetical protein ACVLV4_002213 [Rathayibacter agropyri]